MVALCNKKYYFINDIKEDKGKKLHIIGMHYNYILPFSIEK